MLGGLGGIGAWAAGNMDGSSAMPAATRGWARPGQAKIPSV